LTPTLSIVIPVHDQAPRLRLTLAALETQSGVEPRSYEVIVVDDHSSDDVGGIIEAERLRAPYELRALRSKSGGARGIPRNLGVAESRGELIVFLDADALPSRSLVARHHAAHGERPGGVLLGDAFVLPGTALLLDPADGTPFALMAPTDPLVLPIDRVRCGMDDVLADNAQKGIYPGQAPWHEQLEELLRAGGKLAWTGVIPHNLSLARTTFDRIGGFDETLTHAEGWDFGLRAIDAGHVPGFAAGARSFHLYHSRGREKQGAHVEDAVRVLCERRPDAGIELLTLWTAACLGDPFIPPELDLGNWRAFERRLGSGREELVRLNAAYERFHRPRPIHEAWLGDALNAPFAAR
jgi:glycosyltransferase involved in cell wall biosynthesis